MKFKPENFSCTQFLPKKLSVGMHINENKNINCCKDNLKVNIF